MIIRTFAIAAASCTLIAAPALAGTPGMPQRTVRYSDLNLASPAGVAALHHRIAAAIEGVCGSYDGVVGLNETVAIDRCRAAARSEADRRVAALLSTGTQVASAR